MGTDSGGLAGVLNGAARLVVRLVFLAVGIVFALSLLVAVLLLLAFWLLRAGWAKLTGRPVMPFVMRMDPRAGFTRFRDAGARPPRAAREERLHDVTDVESREIPPPAPSPSGPR